MKKNLDITKPRYSEQILPAPWAFTILRFCCTQQFEILATGLLLSSHHIFKVLGLRFYFLHLLAGFFFYVHFTDQLSISGIKASKLFIASGLSLRGGGRGFPPPIMNVAPGYFHR